MLSNGMYELNKAAGNEGSKQWKPKHVDRRCGLLALSLALSFIWFLSKLIRHLGISRIIRWLLS